MPCSRQVLSYPVYLATTNSQTLATYACMRFVVCKHSALEHLVIS